MGYGGASPEPANHRGQSPQESQLARDLLSEFQQLYGLRGVWEQHWEQIAQQILPGHIHTFNALSIRTPGQKRTQYVFDSTAILALKRFQAIMDSVLTPGGKRWHSIEPEEKKLLKDRDVRMWCEEATATLFRLRYAYAANFAAQNLATWASLGAYGTGSLFVDELVRNWTHGPGTRYRNLHIGETYIREDHQGIVDCVYRYFQMTARQAYLKWGDRCPAEIRQAGEKFPDAMFFFLHCVKPREEYDPGRKDSKGMPIGSYYVSITGETLVEESGYRAMPVAVARYEQFSGEVYGRGPGIDVLPDVRMVNEMSKTTVKAGHRALDPVLLVHDDGVISGFSLRPGAINSGAVTSDGRPLVHALPTGNIQMDEKVIEPRRANIRSAFLNDLFQILVEGPEMTATEVLERIKEKGLLLNPTFARMQSEYLGPVIARELDIALEHGYLPPPPAALRNYQIVYSAPVNRDMQAEEAAGLERALQEAAQLAQLAQRPDVMDVFDLDTAIPEIAMIRGAKTHWLNSPEAVAKIRSDRAKTQREQQTIQAAPGAAALVKASAVAGRGATPQNMPGRAPK